MSVRVQVRTVDGSLTELTAVEPTSNVKQLKTRISEVRKVPPQWQKLIMGDEILVDGIRLDSVLSRKASPEADVLCLTLVISFEDQCSARAQLSMEGKMLLLTELNKSPFRYKNNDVALDFATYCLADGLFDVR